MSINVTGHQTQGYQIETEVYEGPLDLLLELIEKAELDITKVSLAKVTDQYLAHIKIMQNLNPAEVSAFLVIATKLLQIKSEVLLPQPTSRELDEPDPGEALAQQLILYKKFKQAAIGLHQRTEHNLRTYLRIVPPPKIESRLDLQGIGLADLVQAAMSVLFKNGEKMPLSTVVSLPKITIREKISHILAFIRGDHHTSFRIILGHPHSSAEIVVTFLAMLELIKRHIIQASQASLFSDIDLQPLTELNEGDDFELEFGE